jgi:DNA-binding NarL/FixJ family response regulator
VSTIAIKDWRMSPMSFAIAGTRKKIEHEKARPIRILSVDDSPLLREGIAALVKSQPDMKLVAEAANGREAVEQFRKHRPDVTLMDLCRLLNGIEAMTAIRKEFPDARVVLLTDCKADTRIRGALRAGARGYLLKTLLRRELLETIRAVYAGKKYIPDEVAAQLADHADADELTAREIEVLHLIASGNANKAIGARLSISEGTVKGHVKRIISKLDAKDRTHAMTIGLKRGIIGL